MTEKLLKFHVFVKLLYKSILKGCSKKRTSQHLWSDTKYFSSNFPRFPDVEKGSLYCAGTEKGTVIRCYIVVVVLG